MSLNWGQLVNGGRAKAHGVPWTEDEWDAVQSGIPADFVRQGVMTMEEYEKRKDSDDPKYRDIHVLRRMALEQGIEYTLETTKGELTELLEAHASAKEKDMEEEQKQEAPAEEPQAEAPAEEAPAEEPKEEAPAEESKEEEAAPEEAPAE